MAASDILERAENSDNKEQGTFPSELKEKHNQMLDNFRTRLNVIGKSVVDNYQLLHTQNYVYQYGISTRKNISSNLNSS